MKNLAKIVTVLMVIALAVSATGCSVATKTAERREEYTAQIENYVDLADFGEAEQEAVKELIAEYTAYLETVASNAKMKTAVEEFKAAVDAINSIEDLVNAYIAEVSKRIDDALEDVLEELDATAMGISNVTYDATKQEATFYVCDDQIMIRNFAETGVCEIFQAMFKDVAKAEILTDDGQTSTMTHEMLFGGSLKHNVGEYFIKLFVEDYTYATLDNLLGRSATATIYFETGAAAYNTTGSSTFSCKFVAAN